jgi:hypothetical protein
MRPNLSGPYEDEGDAIATDTSGHAFVTGSTASTPDRVSDDVFVAKVKATEPPPAPTWLPMITNGADLVLSWNRVDTAANYQLFRSSVPYFTPGDWSSGLLPLPAPTATSYTDTGALTLVNSYFYVVKTVDNTPSASANSNRVGKFTFGLVRGSN